MTRKKGFTLLEVLVALAILSAILILAFRVVAEAVTAQQRAEQWTAAALLGERLLRETTAGFPEVHEIEGKFPPPDESYSWKKIVRQAVHPDAREVHVTVTWGPPGKEESVTLSGLAVR